jgi:hypothetical protein
MDYLAPSEFVPLDEAHAKAVRMLEPGQRVAVLSMTDFCRQDIAMEVAAFDTGPAERRVAILMLDSIIEDEIVLWAKDASTGQMQRLSIDKGEWMKPPIGIPRIVDWQDDWGPKPFVKCDNLEEWLARRPINQGSAQSDTGLISSPSHPQVAPSSNAAKNACRIWLRDQMRASPGRANKPRPHSKFREEAKARFPNLSDRSFSEAWKDASAETGSGWSDPGRPKKTAPTNPRAK